MSAATRMKPRPRRKASTRPAVSVTAAVEAGWLRIDVLPASMPETEREAARRRTMRLMDQLASRALP